MSDPIQEDAALVEALKLTADPPESWIQAAVLIPPMLADLETLVAEPGFRARFAADPRGAVSAAGLEPSPQVLAAVRERLAV